MTGHINYAGRRWPPWLPYLRFYLGATNNSITLHSGILYNILYRPPSLLRSPSQPYKLPRSTFRTSVVSITPAKKNYIPALGTWRISTRRQAGIKSTYPRVDRRTRDLIIIPIMVFQLTDVWIQHAERYFFVSVLRTFSDVVTFVVINRTEIIVTSKSRYGFIWWNKKQKKKHMAVSKYETPQRITWR